MRKLILPSAFIALLAAFAARAAAQTELLSVGWEVSKLAGKTRQPYAPISSLALDPEAKFTDKLRAVITLRNPGQNRVEGLVVRYALRLKMQKAGDAPEKAFWGVPYYTEEVRVASVGPQSERQARAVNFWLAEQFAKLRGTGFSPVALKMEVALCPRAGDEPAALGREAVLEIARP